MDKFENLVQSIIYNFILKIKLAAILKTCQVNHDIKKVIINHDNKKAVQVNL